MQASELALQKMATDKRKNVGFNQESLANKATENEAQRLLDMAFRPEKHALSISDQGLVKEILQGIGSFKKSSPREQDQKEIVNVALDLYKKGNQLLRAASTNNQQEVSRLLALVDSNAVRDCDGNSPLARVILGEHTFLAHSLLKKTSPNTINAQGLSPLDIALALKRDDVVAALQEVKAQSGNDIQYQAALFNAVRESQQQAVTNYLTHCSPSCVNAEQNSLLHCAVQEGKKDMVEFLITQCKVPLNLNNKQSKTPLDLATDKGMQEILKKYGALTFDESHKSSLFLAVAQKKGNLSDLRTLAEQTEKGLLKRIVDTQDDTGNTPLMYAVAHGLSELVEFLIDTCGASVDKTNNQGVSCLDVAEVYKRTLLKSFLRESGAKTTNQADVQKRITLSFSKDEEEERTIDPLIAVRSEKHRQIIQEHRKKESSDFLDCAKSGNIRGLKDLIAKGLIERDPRDDEGNGALACAVLNEQKEAAELLLVEGARCDAYNKAEESILDLALRSQHREIITLLLNAGAKKGENIFLQSRWFTAAMEGDAEKLYMLLEGNPNALSLKDRDGNTALMVAVESGQFHIVRILIEECGAYIHEFNENSKKTALDYAAKFPFIHEYLKNKMALTYQDVVMRSNLIANVDKNTNGVTSTIDLIKKEDFERACRIVHSYNKLGQTIYGITKDKPEYTNYFKGNDLNFEQLPHNYKDAYRIETERLARLKNPASILSVLEEDLGAKDPQKIKIEAIALVEEGNKKILSMIDSGVVKRDIVDDENAEDLLALAVRKSWLDLVLGLLARKYNPNTINKKGETCLDIINTLTKFDKIKQVVLEHGARDGAQVRPFYAAFEAASKGDVERLKSLINQGLSVDTVNDEGNSLVAVAAASGQPSSVVYLVEKGAKLRTYNKRWATPVDLCKNTELKNYLVQRGGCSCSLLIKIEFLIKFAKEGQLDNFVNLVETLTQEQKGKGLSNIKEENGKTPLMVAATYGHLPFVQKLLQKYAVDIDATCENRTALDWAGNNQAMSSYLIQQRAHCYNQLPPATLVKTQAPSIVMDLWKKSVSSSPRDLFQQGEKNVAEENKQLPRLRTAESPQRIPVLEEKKPASSILRDPVQQSGKNIGEEQSKITLQRAAESPKRLLGANSARLIGKALGGSRAAEKSRLLESESDRPASADEKIQIKKEKSRELEPQAHSPVVRTALEKTKTQKGKLDDFVAWYASVRGKPERSQELLELVEKNPNTRLDEKGNTALHIAAVHGRELDVRALIETCNANSNMLNYEGKSAYDAALGDTIKAYLENKGAKSGEEIKTCVDEMIKLMPKPQSPDNFESLKAYITAKKIAPDACGANGQNAVNYAASKGFLSVIKYFVEDCKIKDLSPLFITANMTPLEAAHTYNKQETIAYLNNKGAKRAGQLPKITW